MSCSRLDSLRSSVLNLFGVLIMVTSHVSAAQQMWDQIHEKAAPSVALVLAGKSAAEVDSIGSALVVRENGILLTPYRVIRDAKAVQVRFKNGEVFDDVQLLGIDRRRDIAAIRISASGLPILSVIPVSQAKAGDAICMISHPTALPWTASAGNLGAYRMADEVPGAGTGYRLIEFTAPAPPGSNGGVLINLQGQALGLVTGAPTGGKNPGIAVPVESVLGLADAPVATNFDSGAQLKMRADTPIEKPPVAEVAPKSTPAAPPKVGQAPSEDFDKSELLKSKDRDFILSKFRTMCVDAHDAKFFGNRQMIGALGANKDFAVLNVMVVDECSLADAVLEVGYTFAWDYPFSLRHQNTSIMLVSGKGKGPFSGPAGASSVAKELTKLLKPYRALKPVKPEPADKRAPAKPQ